MTEESLAPILLTPWDSYLYLCACASTSNIGLIRVSSSGGVKKGIYLWHFVCKLATHLKDYYWFRQTSAPAWCAGGLVIEYECNSFNKFTADSSPNKLQTVQKHH